MKFQQLHLLLLCVFGTISCATDLDTAEELNPSLLLWYDKPARQWTEALPLGNGRIGAMVYGGTSEETIQFNEETLWTGQPHDYTHEAAYEHVDELRRLLWEGKQAEAHDLGNRHFMSRPLRQQTYQPFGAIELKFHGHESYGGYQRKLDLENAVCSVDYEVDGVKFSREFFVSHPDQAIIGRVEASEKGALNFTVGLNTAHARFDVSVENDEIILRGKADNYPEASARKGIDYPESKLHFEARLKIMTEGGHLDPKDNHIEVVNANAATLQLVAATSFVSFSDISGDPAKHCLGDLENLQGQQYATLKKEHTDDYQQLFNRVSVDLGQSDISLRPTDQRLISFKTDEDPSLVSLLFQYGRYLLISSSRKGTQPANLQGIWNDQMAPAWDSKYTININTEMNYWPAEITNLSELANPLFKMVEDLAITGQNVAKEHYNLPGWVAHHNTDLWRAAAPINNANHGVWVVGGAWLCQHLWWHYEFTGDTTFLRKRAYPILKEAAQFFVDYLVPSPDHPEWLISGPSNSPETGGMVMGPTMDHQIIRNLFANTIEASEMLDVDPEFAQTLKTLRAKIAPNQIGSQGQLQEWMADEDDPNNQHRHVSHLWGLHPGNEIHPLTTPELAAACKVTLAWRGDGGTGWSRAWKINFWARLLDGDHAFLLLKNLMVPSISQDVEMNDRGGLYYNLFDAHPPFQIDGNFGATSGIAELLLQSHLRDENGDYYQDILPALPSKISQGQVAGLRSRGGFEFAIRWENGQLQSVDVKSLLGRKLLLRHQGKLIDQETTAGGSYSFSPEDFR